MEEKIVEETITEIKPEKAMEKKPLTDSEVRKLEQEALEMYKESEMFKEKLIIGITGHRTHREMKGVARSFGVYYLKPNKDKIDYVILGGAYGWDTMIAQECIKYDIPFKLYMGFEEGIKRLPASIVDKAIEITWEKKKYTTSRDKRHYKVRNRKIVSECDELHCYLRKQDGGTVTTVNHCMTTKKNKNKSIFNWHNLSFINLPNAPQELLLGYRLYHFGKVIDRLKMKRKT